MWSNTFLLKQLALLFCLVAVSTVGLAQTSKSYKKAIKKHRKSYKNDFLKNDQGPLDKKGVKQLTFFEADGAFQKTCNFQRTPDEKPFEMATYSGITKPYVKYGTATCPFDEKEIELAVYQSLQLRKMPMYRDYLFVPFKDDTNGELTYGGGRYMDISMKDIKNDEVVLDFNKAYNPYCAYSDGYNCPVPPLENHLELEILVGEKAFKK
jgi:uncharacterized protein (DUF1684 family)